MENHFQYFCIRHFVTCNPTEVNETIWELRYSSMQVEVTQWACQVKTHTLDVKVLSLKNRSRSYSKLLENCCRLCLFSYGQIMFAVKDTEI